MLSMTTPATRMELWDLYGGSKGDCDTTFARLWFEAKLTCVCWIRSCFWGSWMPREGPGQGLGFEDGMIIQKYKCKFLFHDSLEVIKFACVSRRHKIQLTSISPR